MAGTRSRCRGRRGSRSNPTNMPAGWPSAGLWSGPQAGARNTAENPLPQAAVPISAGHNQISANFFCFVQKCLGRFAIARLDDVRLSLHPVSHEKQTISATLSRARCLFSPGPPRSGSWTGTASWNGVPSGSAGTRWGRPPRRTAGTPPKRRAPPSRNTMSTPGTDGRRRTRTRGSGFFRQVRRERRVEGAALPALVDR